MLVLGVDPGTAVTGWGLVRTDGRRLRAEGFGVIRTAASSPLEERLAEVYKGIGALLDRERPDLLAVENPFTAKNAHSALLLGQARGVVVAAGAARGVPVRGYSPREVKVAVTGDGGAGKEQVQDMVKILLKLDAIPKPADASDGLAVAICSISSGWATG